MLKIFYSLSKVYRLSKRPRLPVGNLVPNSSPHTVQYATESYGGAWERSYSQYTFHYVNTDKSIPCTHTSLVSLSSNSFKLGKVFLNVDLEVP